MIQLDDLKIEQDYSGVQFNGLLPISACQLQEIKDEEPAFSPFGCLFDTWGNSTRTEQLPFAETILVPKDVPSATEEQNMQDGKQKVSEKLKNQTKNIPKNFGKGIISFVERSEAMIRPLVTAHGLDFNRFLSYLKQQKRFINTIADLRRLWTDPQLGCCLRTVSNLFFRKHALSYIFNSRIRSYSTHVKYRQTMWHALRTPHGFNHIKQF